MFWFRFGFGFGFRGLLFRCVRFVAPRFLGELLGNARRVVSARHILGRPEFGINRLGGSIPLEHGEEARKESAMNRYRENGEALARDLFFSELDHGARSYRAAAERSTLRESPTRSTLAA